MKKTYQAPTAVVLGSVAELTSGSPSLGSKDPSIR
jgi:hypothetical protein